MVAATFPDHVIEDGFWARMIDGRANYFHLLFIEPHLHERHAQELLDAVAEGTLSRAAAVSYTAPTPVHRAAVRALRATRTESLAASVGQPWHASARPAGLPLLVVAGDGEQRSGTAMEYAQLAGAIAELRETALAYFVDLAVGAVVLGDAPSSLEVVTTSNSLVPGAVGLLRLAARTFVTQWLTVEARSAGRDVDLFATADLVEILSGAIVHEHLRRRNLGLDSRGSAWSPGTGSDYVTSWASMLAVELTVESVAAELSATHPLCVELLRCWYPCHPRWTALFDSPFDYMSSL